MKKFAALALCLIISFPQSAYGLTDERIFTDPVKHTYSARKNNDQLIANLSFTDLPSSHWAKEAVIRSGSLNMVKGYNDRYMPAQTVTNEEALAFIIRMAGLENDALIDANDLKNSINTTENLKDIWSIGYLSVARKKGIITNQEYTSFISEPTEGEDIETEDRKDPATRERVAHWLALGLNSIAEGAIELNGEKQKIYNFSDWQSIGSEYAASVDAVASAGIMKGDDRGRFNPKSGLTRAEMAQVLRNMDSIYNNLYGIEKKTGTVAGYRDNQETYTAAGAIWRNYYIRTADGGVDVIQYQLKRDSAGETGILDTVVYKNGTVGGLSTLSEGDTIEYLVNTQAMEALYVQVLSEGPAAYRSVEGKLYSADTNNGTITIQDSKKKTFVYKMMDGVYDKEENYIIIDQAKNTVKSLPIGSNIRLNLRNDVIESVNFLGEPVLVEEMRGIVIENNAEFGYLTFMDNNGSIVTKNYYADSIKVEKQQYYDMDDEIGYLDEVFPSFEYDPRDTDIAAIEAGDIVFMRFDKDDKDLISNISASVSYIAKYGKIKEITYGEGISRFLIEYENKQTGWYDVATGVFASKEGKPVDMGNIKIGDWAKFLVNQAIIEPGYIMESIKEINVEGDEHFISNIIKGQLAGIEPVQNKLIVQNAQTLTKTGWGNYQTLQQFSINNKDIEYYYQGERISLDYAQRYLKRSDGEVYIALENSASGERVKKITFRNGRDELLDPETVLASDGNGSFTTISKSNIATDSGTIVRRHGRLVDGNGILASDYVKASLNGGLTAAVVDITDAPDTSGIMIARARVLSVDEGKSFKAQSMSVLSGNSWVYTPVQREFTIDYNTIFFNSDGIVSSDNFIDYTSESVKDKAFNVVYDGSKALRIIEAPYAREMVTGTVYNISGDTVSIKDAKYYDRATGKWNTVSNVNSILEININGNNAIIGKNNSLISVSNLEKGDLLKVMTDELPAKVIPESNINGYIVLVEN